MTYRQTYAASYAIRGYDRQDADRSHEAAKMSMAAKLALWMRPGTTVSFEYEEERTPALYSARAGKEEVRLTLRVTSNFPLPEPELAHVI